MMVAREDHFVGHVRHTMYTPGVYGLTTQVLKTIHLAVSLAPYTWGPSEIIKLSSDLLEEEPEEELEEAPKEEADVEEDLDYKPSKMLLFYMSGDDSDDSGYTQPP